MPHWNEPMRENVVEVLYKGLTIANTLLTWAGKKVTRRELADKTGLAPKQVGRYLNTLEALHFGVFCPNPRICGAQHIWGVGQKTP